MPAYSTTNPHARQLAARVIRTFRSAMRAGDCRAAKNAMQSIGAMAMDISDLTYWRLHRRYRETCKVRRR